MLVRGAILLTILTVVPFTLSRHIDKSTNEETVQHADLTSESSNSKRQLRKTHLRIHSKPPKTLHVQEGDSEFLECQAGGTPAPAIHWLKDGILISQSEATQESPQKSSSDNDGGNTKRKINVSFTSSRLYLDCLSVEDEGEYSCVAENPYQRISTTTRFTVSSSDEEISCGMKSHGQAPRIFLWTKTMIGTQGEQGKLTCRADGYPRPTIRWLGVKDEELAKADFSKFEILSDGDLIVRHMNWTDMGTYKCVAENVHGEAKVEAFLYPTVPDK